MSGDLSVFELWGILSGSDEAWNRWAEKQERKEAKKGKSRVNRICKSFSGKLNSITKRLAYPHQTFSEKEAKK